MKSSLKKKLRGFGLQKSNSKTISSRQPSTPLDELAQATKDMQDMRSCYDSLLSAAAATANSAFEFSEALRDMGTCLLEKSALNDDEESGSVLLKLGKVQFELQKLVDRYRSHIVQTITTPSESLLNELRTVEEMKRQCDEKRNIYEHMMAGQREKAKSKSSKVEGVSSQELQRALEEYDEEATLFVFRLKSLKQGQYRSLLTQAARHHASQLTFFRKGVKSLEAIEPNVKLVTEKQHIDYQFSGLEDDDAEDGNDDGYDVNDNGELSFDYGPNDHGKDVPSPSRNSMELDQMEHTPASVSAIETTKEDIYKSPGDLNALVKGPRPGSQSAPLFPDRKFDPTERMKEANPLSTRKFHTYVLPTPINAKGSVLADPSNPTVPSLAQPSMTGRPHNLLHSSPLEPRRHVKDGKGDLFSETTLKEGSKSSNRIPPPLVEGHPVPQSDPYNDAKKVKRNAISGPLTSKGWSDKQAASSGMPSTLENPHTISRVPYSSASPRISPSASPPLMASPQINELHELPRPPVSSADPIRPSSFAGHSAPLASRDQELSTNKIPFMATRAASPLPTPPVSFPRSYSIPSSLHRSISINLAKLEASQSPNLTNEISSPPLTPIPFPGAQSTPTVGSRAHQPES